MTRDARIAIVAVAGVLVFFVLPGTSVLAMLVGAVVAVVVAVALYGLLAVLAPGRRSP
jgi:hypothetical protein